MAQINIRLTGILFFLLLVLGSCTKYNYIDTGTADGKHSCSMWDYFKTDSYNWDSTMLFIEHAGMKDLFEGKDEQHKVITFFGLTNHSIRIYMLENNKVSDKQYNRVSDIPVAVCRSMLNKLIIPQRLMMNDVPRGNRVKGIVDGVSVWNEVGGETYSSLSGSLFLYTYQDSFNGIPDAGAVKLYMVTSASQKNAIKIASCNIETTTGVVHALPYDFRFTDL